MNKIKDLTISLPDEICDSVVNLLKQIPNVILNVDDIPEWHKVILDSRYAEFLNNPKNESSFQALKSRQLSDDKISGNS